MTTASKACGKQKYVLPSLVAKASHPAIAGAQAGHANPNQTQTLGKRVTESWIHQGMVRCLANNKKKIEKSEVPLRIALNLNQSNMFIPVLSFCYSKPPPKMVPTSAAPSGRSSTSTGTGPGPASAWIVCSAAPSGGRDPKVPAAMRGCSWRHFFLRDPRREFPKWW